MKRGDIYQANLNPTVGSEQAGTRPVSDIKAIDKALKITLDIY